MSFYDYPKNKIKLNSGIEVIVERLSFAHTYEGWLEGRPDMEYTFKRNKRKFDEFIGYKEAPKYIHSSANENPNEILPKAVFFAWLTSKHDNGSELYVMWFDDIPLNKSIENIVENGLSNIDWTTYAKERIIT